ncbi:MAG: PQQ-dependent sugar dehydrogenase, partial [Rhodospirillales bacterium]
MTPTLRHSVLVLSLAACALSLPVWLRAQPAAAPAAPAQPAVPPAGGQPARAGRGPGGAPRGQRGNTGPAANTLPFVTQRALGGLAFDQPVGIVAAPGDGNRLFIIERPGRIIVIPDVTKPERVTFLDITADVGDSNFNERGLLALAFHPDWKNNHQFYVWFTATVGGQSLDTLARFTISATDPNHADRSSKLELISQLDEAPNHNGGQLGFGSDGYLYASLGDEGDANDKYQNSQRIDKDFFSGMIRIDVDKKPGSLAPNPHPSVHAGTYMVPADNPWVGAKTFNNEPVDPAKVHTEYWAVGLRNPWRWSFDSVTKLLWLADVGQDRIEEVDIIHRGGNYGWNYREGYEIFYTGLAGSAARGGVVPPAYRPTPAGLTFDEPVFTYFHPVPVAPAGDINTGNSITGGLVYRGQALPALNERYLFADYVSGLIWALGPVQPGNVNGLAAKATAQIVARRSGITTFGLDPVTGDVLVAILGDGSIERLIVNPAPV